MPVCMARERLDERGLASARGTVKEKAEFMRVALDCIFP